MSDTGIDLSVAVAQREQRTDNVSNDSNDKKIPQVSNDKQTPEVTGPCFLMTIPLEAREVIYSFLLGDKENKTNLTTAGARRNFRPALRLKDGIPLVFKDIKTLLRANKTIYKEIKDFIPRSTTCVNTKGDAQADLPLILSADHLSVIHRFEMRLEFHLKCHHRRYWPAVIAALCELPNLEYLRLYSETEVGCEPYPQHESGDPQGSVTKDQQERRALRSLAAWVSHRHPNLDLVIEPARSGHSFKTGEYDVVFEVELRKYQADRNITFNKLTKFSAPAAVVEVDEFETIERPVKVVEDQIINTTAVRRVKWTEGCTADPAAFYIAPPAGGRKCDITTSEVPTADDQHFWMVDQRGYQPRSMFAQRGWPTGGGIEFVDGMIDHGRRLKANMERRQQGDGAGRGRGHGNGRARGRGGRFQVAWRGGCGHGRGG